MTSRMRIGGLATGMDTEAAVKEMMKIEQAKLDRLKGSKVHKEWTQTAYRDMIKLVNEFKGKYFDVLKKDNFLKSPSTFTTNKAKSSKEEAIFVKNAGTVGNYNREISVKQKAEVAKLDSGSKVSPHSDGIYGTEALDASSKMEAGSTFVVVLDGEVKKIVADETVTGADNIKTKLNTLLLDAYGVIDGSSKVRAELDGSGKLSIKLNNKIKDSAKLELIDPGDANILKSLGFGESKKISNKLNVEATLKEITGIDSNSAFEINGVKFDFKSDVKLSEVIKQINASQAGVNMRYDEISDLVRIESKSSGTGSKIDIKVSTDMADSGKKLIQDVLKLDTAMPKRGKDAIVVIDGNELYRSSNNFTVDGINYELKDVTLNESIKITVESDTGHALKTIKEFVADYNAMIKGIHDRLGEKKYRSFTPLTDEQKSSMKEGEIKLWEDRAKSGILRNDTMLNGMLTNMRLALSNSVNGISLSQIGITTTRDYKENGKLVIDEDKLVKALETRGSEITDLFTLSPQEGKAEKGIAYVLEGIINDNVGTVGEKGMLLKKAGIEGDRTVGENILQKEISDYEKQIQDMIEKMATKEDNYYKRFATLETMMQKMNQQSGWLSQQLGGGK